MNMEATQTFINHGMIDHTKILKIIEDNNLDWNEYTGRQEKFITHCHTKTIPIIYDKSFNLKSFKIIPTNIFSLFENEILKIEDIINKSTNEDGKIMRALLVKLPSGKSIPPHVDSSITLSLCRRIHIPIQTNENCFFTVGEDKRNLKLGEMWEINNDKQRHSVDNLGESDRIHLIIDWAQASLLE